MKNDDFLMHYASLYYDPVKAHEYYMKNRELKGRRSTSALSDEGKEIWSYTKNQIKAEKAERVEEEQNSRDQNITALRERASQTKEEISSKLKQLNEALSNSVSSRKEEIESSRDSEIAKIESRTAAEREGIEKKPRLKLKD